MTQSALTRVAAGFFALTFMVACQPGQSESETENDNKTALETDIAKASYLIGYDQASQLSTQTSDVIDIEAFAQGALDAAGDVDPQVSDDVRAQVFGALQTAVNEAQSAEFQDTIDAGNAYREEYAQKEGVQKTESGLLYEVMTEGDGPKPTAEDTVSTHYHGTLISGEVFDSSVDRGQPASFPVGGVIRGWTEALQLMPVGSKWRLVIPPELAYGERGAGASIGPHATLIFEVELLEIL